MTTVMHLPELPAGSDEPLDPAFIDEFRAGSARWLASWPEVLAMAVRDGAASVHYHPWRSNAGCDDLLSYIVGGTRYGLVPPTDDAGARLVALAHRLAAPGPLGRLRAWAAGGVVGRVRLATASGESEWVVVCWGRGGLTGVEFLRLSPAPAAALLI